MIQNLKYNKWLSEYGNVEKLYEKLEKARRSLAFVLLVNVEKVLKRQE